jgi:hypothetical protein
MSRIAHHLSPNGRALYRDMLGRPINGPELDPEFWQLREEVVQGHCSPFQAAEALRMPLSAFLAALKEASRGPLRFREDSGGMPSRLDMIPRLKEGDSNGRPLGFLFHHRLPARQKSSWSYTRSAGLKFRLPSGMFGVTQYVLPSPGIEGWNRLRIRFSESSCGTWFSSGNTAIIPGGGGIGDPLL